jgi:carboxyl-terminal processing protease
MFKKIRFCAFLLAVSGSIAIGKEIPPRSEPSGSPKESVSGKELKIIGNVLEYFKRFYVDEKASEDASKVLHRALNGILGADPHSCYFDAQEYKSLCEHNEGKFSGLGIEITRETSDSAIRIIAAIDDTPAALAGLKAKDLIVAINNTPVATMTLLEAVDRMRGEPGTTVTLLIKREGVKQPLSMVITRKIIAIRSVKWRAEGDVGYIRISTFDEKVGALTEQAILELKKKIGKPLKGFVIDLRDNPGGILDQAVAVANLFIDRGIILSTKGRRSENNTVVAAIPRNALVHDTPLVVLINDGSASASEIVAGALQDHKKAIVLGDRSFGKGSVQSLLPLEGGKQGAIKLTIARFYTPLGRPIQGRGIIPDIPVKQMALVEANPLIQIREKNLANSLSPEEAAAQDDKTKDPASAEGDLTAKDYQLTRAIETVRALAIFTLNKANGGEVEVPQEKTRAGSTGQR